MRTLTAQEAKAIASAGYSVRSRARIRDAGGTLRDLTAIGPQLMNFFLGAEYGESVDDPLSTATVELLREVFGNSISPLVPGSRQNSAAGGILVDVGRELLIDSATVPLGMEPVSGDWRKAFHGYVDSYDEGRKAGTVRLQCRDLGARLQDIQIEEETAYGTWRPGRFIRLNTVIVRSYDQFQASTAQFWKCTTGGLTCGARWAALTSFGSGRIIRPTEDNGHFYSSGGGTSGASEPTWPTTPGGTVVDGSVTWTEVGATAEPAWPASPTAGVTTQADGSVVWTYQGHSTLGTDVQVIMQSILDDWADSVGVTLNVPVSPDWKILAFKQKQTNVLSALRDLAIQIGWDLRYRYDTGASDFLLTLYEPQRSSPSVDFTLGPSFYEDVTRARKDIVSIRNKVSVTFSDVASLDRAGQPRRRTVISEDAASIVKYGLRAMAVAEASSSNINTLAEAQQFADAMLSDLAEPLLDHEAQCPYLYHLQLNDFLAFTANGLLYSADQDLATMSLRHQLNKDGVARTIIGSRGLPAMGGPALQSHGVFAGNAPAVSTDGPPQQLASGVTLLQTTGGLTLTWNPPRMPKWGYAYTEVHASTTTGFIPSSSTLVGATDTGRMEVTRLDPAVGMYFKLVHVDQAGNADGGGAGGESGAQGGSIPPTIAQAARRELAADVNWTADTVIKFARASGSNVYDTQGLYNTGTGLFTIKVDGKYRITGHLQLANTGGSTTLGAADRLSVYLDVNSGTRQCDQPYYPAMLGSGGGGGTDKEIFAPFECTLDLKAGDTLGVMAQGTVTAGGGTVKVKALPGTPAAGSPGSWVEIALVHW